MNEGLQMLDMIILLALAVFFISRLRNILGKQIDDSNRKPTDKSTDRRNAPGQGARVVPLREGTPLHAGLAAAATPQPEDDAPLLNDIDDPDVSKGLMDIKSAEPGFNVREFLGGAKMAFEMIVEAYAKGDKEQLQFLLSEDIYRDFEAEIDASQQADTREETTLVSIQSADIVRAGLRGKTAEITVSFVSEQITVERDKDGEMVGGDPSRSVLVNDEWTFAREVRSPNPNWMLVGT